MYLLFLRMNDDHDLMLGSLSSWEGKNMHFLPSLVFTYTQGHAALAQHYHRRYTNSGASQNHVHVQQAKHHMVSHHSSERGQAGVTE